jgi:pyruvate dehydrogenase E2 component (dihydrolipoamide acetyltransferase)
VVKVDVEAAAARPATTPVGSTALSGDVDADGRPFVQRPVNAVKLSQMRKTIAKRMTQQKAGAPHFYLTIEIDMSRAAEMRAQVNEALSDTKVSFNDILLLACARVLRDHPRVNAYFDTDKRVEVGDIHIGVAVAVEDGLVVPVVRYADQKTLRAISVEVRELGRRAKDKKLLPESMVGSTFTVSNLGMFGLDEFSAIVNPGEGALLAVGGIDEKPVVVDGQIVIRKRMRATLSCDHRAMDGADGARFLQALKKALEHPVGLLAS